jgi:hypothetical protein
MACGIAFAEDAAPVDANPPIQTTAPKAKPAVAAKAKAKPAVAPGKVSKNAGESKNASARPGSGRMQVEEPKAAVSIGTAKESRNWQKNHARGLTEVQKQAFRERKEKMEGMIAVIKEKRKALRDAKPEERAVLARELHSLILEKDPDAANSGATAAASTAATTAAATAATARVGVDANGSEHPVRPSAQTDAAKTQPDVSKKAEAAEQRRQRIESYQLQQQKKEELRRLYIEKQRSSLDNGGNTWNTYNAQAAQED